MEELSVEERLTKLEALVAQLAGGEVGGEYAPAEGQVEASFTDLQKQRWEKVIAQLVADNGWTVDEANTNFGNLLNSLPK